MQGLRGPGLGALHLLLLAIMIAGGLQPFFLSLPFRDREPVRRHLVSFADRHAPSYPRFLREVVSRTREGSRVAIVVPMREWERGYAWAYYRASWFLAGREVVPLLDEDDRFLRENLQRADFVASWGGEARLPRFVPLWRGPDGILYGRER